MGQMLDILDIGEEQDDDDLDTEDADLLTQAQRILFRLVMQEDPAETSARRVALSGGQHVPGGGSRGTWRGACALDGRCLHGQVAGFDSCDPISQ